MFTFPLLPYYGVSIIFKVKTRKWLYIGNCNTKNEKFNGYIS